MRLSVPGPILGYSSNRKIVYTTDLASHIYPTIGLYPLLVDYFRPVSNSSPLNKDTCFEGWLRAMIYLLCWNVAYFTARSYTPPQRNKTLIFCINWDTGIRRFDILSICIETASLSKLSWSIISTSLLRTRVIFLTLRNGYMAASMFASELRLMAKGGILGNNWWSDFYCRTGLGRTAAQAMRMRKFVAKLGPTPPWSLPRPVLS